MVGTVYVQANSFHWGSETKSSPRDADSTASWPEAYSPAGEVEFCQGVAAACDSGLYGQSGPRVCWGIQGTCDLEDPEAPAVLKYLTQTRNFSGVRAGPGADSGGSGVSVYSDDFKRGFQALADLGLVYLLRGICMHTKSHNLHLILVLNCAYI